MSRWRFGAVPPAGSIADRSSRRANSNEIPRMDASRHNAAVPLESTAAP